jgi:glucose dehydrogenase
LRGPIEPARRARPDESAKNAAFEATPILVDGTLYLATPFNRVIALDPEKGTERWSCDPRVDLTHGTKMGDYVVAFSLQ